MGTNQSTEKQPAPAPAPSPLLDEPWRKVPWGNNKENLQYVQNYKPEYENIKHLRVLLYGPVGAGKSSFINSVSNVIRRRYGIPAAASATTSDTSFTRKYETHRFQITREGQTTYYPVFFNDIMGMEENSGISLTDIRLAMRGHVKEGYTFNPVTPLSDGNYYNRAPSEDDKVHVLVCVLSANMPTITPSILHMTSRVRQTASDLGIPQVAMITNIDTACPETEKDLKNVYKSKHLQKKIKKFSSDIGIPMNCIYPVKNYSHEIDLDDDVDTLILSALRNMINFGDDFVKK
ncbi:interferon-induced protein 44-like isoform X2 [Parambassis ranga]|uniref:Interferon-induced protein 44-like isoform X2 n=1 Tax=Parambassis ranga TaxID=210632 RepID=A0A6P7HN06_9TELE|nr:interferon-induced protein 44-like isoform X2 [Parambassis ranga]